MAFGSNSSQFNVADGANSIRIDDWHQFLVDNEYIISCLENMASDCNDIIANVSTTYNCLNYAYFEDTFSGIPSKYKPTYSGDESAVSNLKNMTIQMADYLAEQSTNLMVLQYDVERKLYQYNSSGTPFTLVGDIIDVSEDTLKEFIEQLGEKCEGLSALNFLISFGANSLKDQHDIDHSIDDDKITDGLLSGIEKIREMVAEGFQTAAVSAEEFSKRMMWVNRFCGAAVAGVITGAYEYFTHEGEWTNEQIAEVLLDAGVSALSYVGCAAVSTWVTAKVGAAVGGTIGGPIGAALGAAVGAVASVVITYAWEGIKNVIFGPEVSHTFKVGEISYSVPGRRVNYEIDIKDISDAILQLQGSQTVFISLDDIPYSEEVYKNALYSGNEFFEREFYGSRNYHSDLTIFTNYFLRYFDGNYSTREEFNRRYDTLWEHMDSNTYEMNEMISFLSEACTLYDFDAWEYYNYLKTGSWNCE